MRVNHIGIYVSDLEAARQFFEKYFHAVSGTLYHNPKKGFRSYMLELGGGTRIELMTRLGVSGNKALGVCHISISVGSKEGVDDTTRRLVDDGFALLDGPRTTGDGYYESCVSGIDGNLIEITV